MSLGWLALMAGGWEVILQGGGGRDVQTHISAYPLMPFLPPLFCAIQRVPYKSTNILIIGLCYFALHYPNNQKRRFIIFVIERGHQIVYLSKAFKLFFSSYYTFSKLVGKSVFWHGVNKSQSGQTALLCHRGYLMTHWADKPPGMEVLWFQFLRKFPPSGTGAGMCLCACLCAMQSNQLFFFKPER